MIFQAKAFNVIKKHIHISGVLPGFSAFCPILNVSGRNELHMLKKIWWNSSSFDWNSGITRRNSIEFQQLLHRIPASHQNLDDKLWLYFNSFLFLFAGWWKNLWKFIIYQKLKKEEENTTRRKFSCTPKVFLSECKPNYEMIFEFQDTSYKIFSPNFLCCYCKYTHFAHIFTLINQNKKLNNTHQISHF